MARWFLVTLLVACLLCAVTQAFPQAATAETADQGGSSKIESALSDVVDSLQRSFKQVMEDPGLNKLMQDGQRMLQNAATSIQNEAAKIMPKTAEK